MAANFDGASRLAIATGMDATVTLSLWFYPTDSVGTTQTLWISQNSSSTAKLALTLDGFNGDLYWVRADSGGPADTPAVASGVNMNAWNHVWAQTSAAGGSAHGLRLNGGSLQTGTGIYTGTLDRRRMGARTVAPATVTDFYTGLIAEFLEVNEDNLDNADADFPVRLAKGYYPLSIITQAYNAAASLSNVHYFPFAGRVIDEFNHTTAWTNTGVTLLDGQPPKMIYPHAARKVHNIKRRFTLDLSDTITPTDDKNKAIGEVRADTETLTDVSFRSVGKVASDTVTLTDAETKTVGVGRADTVTLTDAETASVVVARSDSVTLTDAEVAAVGKALADAVTLVDVFVKSVTISRADVVLLSDVITPVLTVGAAAYLLNLSDVTTLVDTIQRDPRKAPLGESVIYPLPWGNAIQALRSPG